MKMKKLKELVKCLIGLILIYGTSFYILIDVIENKL